MIDQWNHYFQNNDIEMYSTLNEGKSVIAERFIRTLKIKFINIWLQFHKISYIDKLDDIVNNTIHIIAQLK